MAKDPNKPRKTKHYGFKDDGTPATPAPGSTPGSAPARQKHYTFKDDGPNASRSPKPDELPQAAAQEPPAPPEQDSGDDIPPFPEENETNKQLDAIGTLLTRLADAAEGIRSLLEDALGGGN